MDGTVLKLFAVAVLCAVTGLLLRQLRGDFSALIRIAACVLIFGWVIPRARSVASEVLALLDAEGMEEYVSVMLRALGLAILTRICTDICRDCGEAGTASGVELAGKIGILALCVPLIEELIGFASEILRMD